MRLPDQPLSITTQDRLTRYVYPQTVRVVAAVVVEGGQVLACRRAAHKSLGGKWEFPGGKIEGDESPQEALVREIREELGVEAIVHEEFRNDTTRVGDQNIELTCFRVTLQRWPVSSTDHDVLTWVSHDELDGLEWAMPDWPMVRQLEGLLG
jgi:8-oxo-dGTP diphosphatase